MPYLLLRAWTCTEWIYEQVDFALVEVSPDLAALILQRMDHAEAHRQVDSNFTCAEYRCYAPQWLESDDVLEELMWDRRALVLHEKPQIAEDQLIRQDGTRVCVEIAGSEPAEVQWRSYIKYTDVQMETESVPRQVFEEIAGRAPVEQKQEFFPAIRLSREDLTHATGRDCTQLPDSVVERMAEKIGDALFEAGGWDVIGEVVELCLEELC